MRFLKHFLLLSVILITVVPLNAQVNQSGDNKPSEAELLKTQKRSDSVLRVMFYNVENLFDTFNDSLTADEEYIPGGIRGWNNSRLKKKLINISKVIVAVGGWNPPDVIGLCEIENRNVLYGLVFDTPLEGFGYRIVHYDSYDPRGIDVALIYRPEKFQVLYHYPIRIKFPFDTASRTRDILFVKGIAANRDTLNIFVNHWPSKFGGAMATIPKRNYVASVLRKHTDSLLRINPNSNILIMGDLNDGPDQESVSKVLQASMDSLNIQEDGLYNMLAGAGISWKRGTIKFREEWETIDHMIVSKSLLQNTSPHGMKIFDAPFLLQDDEAWFGKKPFRTYFGAKYIGGYSDHLPIFLDLKF